MGNFEEAVADLEVALGIDPESLIIKERLKKAQTELRKSKRLDYYKILGISEVSLSIQQRNTRMDDSCCNGLMLSRDVLPVKINWPKNLYLTPDVEGQIYGTSAFFVSFGDECEMADAVTKKFDANCRNRNP